MKAPDLDERVERARSAGYDPGPIVAISRQLPHGSRLEWRLALRGELAGDGLVPFLIDWGGARHPSQTSPPGCTLLALRAEHPRPAPVRAILDALGVALDLREGPAPALVATLATPIGDADLRIASIALDRDLAVVTGNVRHFQKVPGLAVENWL